MVLARLPETDLATIGGAVYPDAPALALPDFGALQTDGREDGIDRFSVNIRGFLGLHGPIIYQTNVG